MTEPETGPDREPTPLERRLASWRPVPANAGAARDRMLYEAGRAGAGRGSAWRGSSLVLAVVALGLAVEVGRERSRQSVLEARLAVVSRMRDDREIAPRPAPRPAEPPPIRLAPSSYRVLTARLNAGDVDLPPPADAAGPSAGLQPRPAEGPTLRPRGLEL